MSDLRQEITGVLSLLVDEPKEVDVREGEGEKGPCLEVSVADGDLGKVIGRQGRTARALRRLLVARAAHGGEPWELKILDN